MQEVILYLVNKVAQVFDPTVIKIVASALLSLSFFFFGDLYNEALMAIVMLILLDTVLGVLCAYRLREEITSRKFGRVVIKGLVYFTAISAGYFADLTIPFNVVESVMIGFIGVTEFISIIETMGKFGFRTPQKLLGQLRSYQNNL